MAIRATVDADGNETVEHLMNTHGGPVSSANYQPPEGSIEFVRGGFRDTTHDLSVLRDDDLVEVEGMQVRVDMARQLGLMGAAAEQPATKQPQHAPEKEQPQQPELTGVEAQIATISEGLDHALESGLMQGPEANTYETSFSQLALAGFDLQEGIELAYRSAAGEAIDGVTAENAKLAADVYHRVKEAADNSARTELSSDDYEWLEQVINNDHHAQMAVEQYVLDRATGRPVVSWPNAVAQLREQINRV